MTWLAPFLLLIAFILGGAAWSLWIGRLRGVDLRRRGSGNLGATNAYRVLGWKLGLLVLILDVAKGAAPVVLARAVAPETFGGSLPALCGLAAVAGHMWTPFAGFRGGKGVATSLGVFLALAPGPAWIALAVWVAVLLLCGWVSLASGAAAIALPIGAVLFREDLAGRYPWVLGLSVLMAVLVLVRHRSNWVRLAAGVEQPIWEKHRESVEADPKEDQP